MRFIKKGGRQVKLQESVRRLNRKYDHMVNEQAINALKEVEDYVPESKPKVESEQDLMMEQINQTLDTLDERFVHGLKW